MGVGPDPRRASRRRGGAPRPLLGGRVGVRVAGDEGVVGVVGLAPWFPPGEPYEQLAGRALVVAHGTADTWTSPAASLQMCRAARQVGGRAARAELAGEKHFLLKDVRLWRTFAARASLGLLRAEPMPPLLARALESTDPSDDSTLRLSMAEAV